MLKDIAAKNGDARRHARPSLRARASKAKAKFSRPKNLPIALNCGRRLLAR